MFNAVQASSYFLQWGRKWYPSMEWINFVEWILTSEQAQYHHHQARRHIISARSLLSVGSYSVLVLSHIPDVLHNPDFTACCCPPTDPCQPADTSHGLHDKWHIVTAWQRDRDSTRHITVTAPCCKLTVWLSVAMSPVQGVDTALHSQAQLLLCCCCYTQ